jgi:hypothetical protein
LAGFAARPAKQRFISPIADGADQIAAEVALELGWELEAVLPFEREHYRASLANHGSRERFDALLGRAACPAAPTTMEAAPEPRFAKQLTAH